MADWRAAVSALTRDSVVALWRSGEGEGDGYDLTGPPGEVVDVVIDERTVAWILHHVQDALRRARGPWVPAGMFLFHVQVSQPFFDGNHRLAWQLCRRVMASAGFESRVPGKGALRFETMDRSRHPANGSAGPDLASGNARPAPTPASATRSRGCAPPFAPPPRLCRTPPLSSPDPFLGPEMPR